MTQTTDTLQALLRTQQIWRGSDTAPAGVSINTGFASLNTALHSGGWPVSGVIELLTNHQGIGELQLTLPAIAHLVQEGRHILFSNTPYTLYAPALQHKDINPAQLLFLRVLKKPDLLWALEQSLSDYACGIALSWLNRQALTTSELRKLQLAAQQGQSLLILYRHKQFSKQHSPAKLRIALNISPQNLTLKILKQPNGWAGQTAVIPLFKTAKPQLAATQLPALTSRHTYFKKPQRQHGQHPNHSINSINRLNT